MDATEDPLPSDVLQTAVDKCDVLAAIDEVPEPTLDGLAAETEYSKSTVNRAIREFVDRGLVDADTSGQPHTYRLTFFGSQLLAWALEGRFHVAHERMYDAVPAGADLPRWIVRGGDVAVVRDGAGARHTPFDQILAFIGRADRFRVVAPALTRDSTFHLVAERVLEEGMDFEWVVPQAFVDTMFERFGADVERMFHEYGVRGYSLGAETVPFGVGIAYHEESGDVVDSEMAVVCYDEHHRGANGSVVNDAPPAVAWAEECFADYRARASPVDVDGRDP